MPVHHHAMPPLSSRYGTSAEPSSLRLNHLNPALKLNLPDRDSAVVEEYSWEWGNFPQKTPVWTAFGQAAGGEKDAKGKGRDFFVDVAAEKSKQACKWDSPSYLESFAEFPSSERGGIRLWRNTYCRSQRSHPVSSLY
jgi:hypothetical protein